MGGTVVEDVLDLGVVDAAHHHRIDADRLHAGLPRRRDAAPHPLQIAARDLAEDLRIQTVETDIEPSHTGTRQRPGKRLQLRRIARQREVVETGQGRQARGQFGQAAPHQRLAPGQTHAPHAQCREGRDHALDLFEAQPVCRLLEPLEALGQTIAAAQIAAIRDRETQIVDAPTKGIGQ